MMSLTVCQEMAPRLIYVIEQDQVLALRSWKFKAGWGGVGAGVGHGIMLLRVIIYPNST